MADRPGVGGEHQVGVERLRQQAMLTAITAIGLSLSATPAADFGGHARLRPGVYFALDAVEEWAGYRIPWGRSEWNVLYISKADEVVLGKGVRTRRGGPMGYEIHRVLRKDGCAVDIRAGIAIAEDPMCKRKFSLGETWTFNGRFSWVGGGHDDLPTTCIVLSASTERLQVPAGTFDSVKISCHSETSSRRYSTQYWYVPTLGVMARIVRRSVTLSGQYPKGFTEQLVEVRDTPEPMPTEW